MLDLCGIVPLRAYQRAVIADKARLKGWVKSRQIGGSFTSTLDMVLDAISTGNDWNTMSRSQRQAEKLLAKAAKHVRAIDMYLREAMGHPGIVDADEIGQRRIRLRNGATLEALPCDPDTTTGDTVNWLIDEFPLFPKSDEIFGVIKPSIMLGKRMIVLGSPRGRNHKFYDLFKTYEELGPASGWSFHRTTIEDAVRDGLELVDHLGNVLTFEQFKAQELRDLGTEMFAQEYMCAFSDKLVAFLEWETIRRAQDERLPMLRTVEQLAKLGKRLYVGVDIGRRHDLTVMWILSKLGDVLTTESIFVLDRCPFREQEALLASILKTKVVDGCLIDQMGIGMQLAENMARDFPAIAVPFTPTNATKAAAANRLKIAMDAGAFIMPADDDVAEDFASIEKAVTGAGNIQISAPRSETGHGDRFWAAAMAVEAAYRRPPFELVLAA